MRELFDQHSLVKNSNRIHEQIELGEQACIGGYIYTKINDRQYESYGAIITIANYTAVLQFKRSCKRSVTRNAFGQDLK